MDLARQVTSDSAVRGFWLLVAHADLSRSTGMLREADLVTQTTPLSALWQLHRQVPLPLVSASAPDLICSVIRTEITASLSFAWFLLY